MIYDGEGAGKEREATHNTTCRQFRKSLFAVRVRPSVRRRRRNKTPFPPFLLPPLPLSPPLRRPHRIRNQLIAARNLRGGVGTKSSVRPSVLRVSRARCRHFITITHTYIQGRRVDKLVDLPFMLRNIPLMCSRIFAWLYCVKLHFKLNNCFKWPLHTY